MILREGFWNVWKCWREPEKHLNLDIYIKGLGCLIIKLGLKAALALNEPRGGLLDRKGDGPQTRGILLGEEAAQTFQEVVIACH